MAGEILQVPYHSSVRPELGFEFMKFSELVVRTLSHPIDGSTRPGFFMVLYGVSGKTRHRVDFERCTVAPHDVSFVAPGRVHAFDPQPGLELWMLLFTPEFLQLGDKDPLRTASVLSPFWMPPVLHVPKPDRAEVQSLFQQLRDEYARPADAVQVSLLSALLRAVLLKLERLATHSKQTVTAPPELELFRDALEKDHARTRNVEDYARAAGVTPRSLNALTKRHFGTSAKQTIDARVVLELKRLLVHTGLSVKQLSAKFGFDEPTNLVKFFRHHTRMTPMQFREQTE